MESVSREDRMAVRNPNLLQLYSIATPNGLKVAACLEELIILKDEKGIDFDYEPHSVDIRHGEQKTPEFQALNPNEKIPVLVDPHGDGGNPLKIFESGAILLYLAEKYVELIPLDPLSRVETLKWLFWGSASFSAQTKLFGFYYKYCPHKLPFCVQRYEQEVKMLLQVLNKQLSHGKSYVVGDQYTIADLSIWPWVHALYEVYDNAFA
eukprot:gene32998-37274_t